LIVEDDAALRDVTARGLAACGFRAITARGGKQALEVCARAEPPVDLVVTDLAMPGMSGIELVDRLRRRCPGLRVLLVSGHGGEQLADGRTSELPFLSKPFSPARLARKIRAVLDQRDPNDRGAAV